MMADTAAEQKIEQVEKNGSTEKAEVDTQETEKSAEMKEAADKTTVDSTSSVTSATEEPSPLEQKIIRQVEYYFGDANLDRDKFLIEEIKKDNGWVSLKVLLTFNRLKALSDDPAVIMTALSKSSNDLLELKGVEAIRRHPTKPLPTGDNRKEEVQKRLLYVKGFPSELTLDDLIEYFDEHGGESTMMRKDLKQKFKGSVFVLFKTPELAKAFLDAPEMKYKDTVLADRMYKQDYYQKKQQERMGGKQEEIKKKEEQKKKKEQEEREELQAKITKGSILKVTGLDNETALDKIKEFFGKFGKIAWVDFEKTDSHAMVRYATENEAKLAWEKAQAEAEGGKVMLGDSELSAVVVEGDEEEAHWKRMFESINNRFKGKSKFGRGGNRGGGRGNKRRGGERDGPSEKRTRADD